MTNFATFAGVSFATLPLGGSGASHTNPPRETDWHYPTVDFGAGANWSPSPDNIQADDDVYASHFFISGSTNGFMYPQAFGFSVPSDAIISGITLEYERYQEYLGGTLQCVRDQLVYTLKAGVTGGTNYGDNVTCWKTDLPAEVITYGGSSDLWGRTWTPSDINASDFGFSIQTFGLRYTGYIDYLRAKVTYHYEYSESASRGGYLGGSSAPSGAITITGTGGDAINGSATPTINYTLAASSGAGTGSIATPTVTFSPLASSGAAMAGTAAFTFTAHTYNETAAGGALCEGSSSFTCKYNETAAGGTVCGGVGENVGTGGCLSGGEALVGVTFTQTVSSGVAIGSASTPQFIITITSESGASCSSQAATIFTYNIAATSGCLANCTIVATASYEAAVGGGIAVGGTSGESAIYPIIVSGGVTSNCQATFLFTYNEIPSSGCQLNSTITPIITYNAQIGDGILSSGLCVESAAYSVFTSGGAKGGGQILGGIIFLQTTAGGTKCGGFIADDYNVDFVMDASIEGVYYYSFTEAPALIPNNPLLALICTTGLTHRVLHLTHNLNSANVLSQFLFRNNLSLPSTVKLTFNRTTALWAGNLAYRGASYNLAHDQIWNIVFEFGCANNLGPTDFGTGIWKFGMYMKNKDLETGEDFDTRIITFFSSAIVADAPETFGFTINTKTKVTKPVSTINTSLNDDIGLFKTTFWSKSPLLRFQLGTRTAPNNVTQVIYPGVLVTS